MRRLKLRSAFTVLASLSLSPGFASTPALDIDVLQRQLTNGAPAAVADLLGAEAEKSPDNVHLAYDHGVASYAARRWEDALVAFDRVEASGVPRLAGLARFQRGNAEFQLGLESRGANLDETISRWKASLEAYDSVLKETPGDERARRNDTFVRDRLARLLLEEAKKSAAQAKRPNQAPAQRTAALRNAFEKFSDAKEVAPTNAEAMAGEAEARKDLAEALKQEGLRNSQAPLSLRPNRREPRLPDVDTSRLEQGLSQLEESRDLKPGDPETEAGIEQARQKLADAKVRQAETFLALEEQVPITKEKLALLRMAREQVDKALDQAPKHEEAKELGNEIDRRMAQVHEDEGDFQEQQSQFGNQEQQAMQLGQALDHFQQAGELRPDDKRLQAKQKQAEEKLSQALEKLADKLMQSPQGQESMESKAARLEGAEQALGELQSLRPSEGTAQKADQVGKELDGLRQQMADKGKEPGGQQGQPQPGGQSPGQGQQPQWAGPPLDGPPRLDQPGSRGTAPKNAGRNLRDY
jgi:hypothetical protein